MNTNLSTNGLTSTPTVGLTPAFSLNSTGTSTEILGSFFLNENEFAISIKSIQEVVNPPERLSAVPLAPPFLLGVFNLRGWIIPVVNLKSILNFNEDNQFCDEKKIAIVDYQGIKIGLLFDKTGEIFRTHPEEKSEFRYSPTETKEASTIGGMGTANVISGAIKLEGGKRIIQILDINALVRLDNIPQTTNHGSQSVDLRLRKNQGSRKQCISFVVGESRCAFGIEVIHEIIKVPPLKESMLTTGNCLGIFDLRGDVVPVVDFAALLKFRGLQSTEQIGEDQRIVIMKIGTEKFGLLIQSVESIVTYHSEELLNLPILNSNKASMFLGCLSRPESGLGDIILLDHSQIFSSQEIHEITKGHSKLYQTNESRKGEAIKGKGQRKTYITFKIDCLYAVGIDEVREIIEYPTQILQPPGLPKSVKGMLNLRGKMITLLDARTLYEMPEGAQGHRPKVLLFEQNKITYGMLVDSVENIVSFAEAEQIKLPSFLQRNMTNTAINEDVKFAVELEFGGERKTVMVLNLDPLVKRI